MSLVYSARFLAAQVVPGTPQSVAVPAGHTWVVRHITFFNGSPGTTVARVYLNNHLYLVGFSNLPQNISQDWKGRHVLYAGDTLSAETAGVTAGVVISGYDLINP